MAVARAQIRGVFKRMFSGVSIPQPPPHLVSSHQITDDNDKLSFLDAVEVTPCPASLATRCDFFIKSSCLKGATQKEKMDFYVKTVAELIGSDEEEAKERIYKITHDCSVDGFGLELPVKDTYRLAIPESVEWMGTPAAGTMYFTCQEMIRWSLIPKERDIEEGRFPLPKPDLHLLGHYYDSESESESDGDYD